MSSKFVVVEVSGRQYQVEPGQEIVVDSLGEAKTIEAKVLLSVDGEKVEVGKPYLKDTVKFEVVKSEREPKIRVAIYHAKANFRKVTGSRRHNSTIKMQEGRVKAVSAA